MIEEALAMLRSFVPDGDFTLGKPVSEFERKFADLIGTKYAIGVNSGTDALKIALEGAGIARDDEVITAANTFIASVGAIAEIGAKPVLIDCDDAFCMDVARLDSAITPRTRAILPVHFTGMPAQMGAITAIARKRGLVVVEDACQAILAEVDGKRCGTWGVAAGYSMHPLKNLHVWGDAGVIVTSDEAVDKRIRLLRNHGMADRDHIALLGHNSRLDSIQALIASWQLPHARDATAKRIANAQYYDAGLANVSGIRIPSRPANGKPVFHLYMVFADRRDQLLAFLQQAGIECKVHYPIPLYQQQALKHLGYKPGAFPVTDRHAKEIITFPVDQPSARSADYVLEKVREFYGSKQS